MTWIINYIHTKRWDAITHPCLDVNVDSAKPPLIVWHGWVIIWSSNGLVYRRVFAPVGLDGLIDMRYVLSALLITDTEWWTKIVRAACNHINIRHVERSGCPRQQAVFLINCLQSWSIACSKPCPSFGLHCGAVIPKVPWYFTWPHRMFNNKLIRNLR